MYYHCLCTIIVSVHNFWLKWLTLVSHGKSKATVVSVYRRPSELCQGRGPIDLPWQRSICFCTMASAALSRTHLRRLQRQHTKRCLNSALAFVKANPILPPDAIQARDLELFRGTLYAENFTESECPWRDFTESEFTYSYTSQLRMTVPSTYPAGFMPCLLYTSPSPRDRG